MESSAVENEQEPLVIQVKPPKCETGSQSTLNNRQSSVWSLNSCLNTCWTRSPQKRSQTSDISRSQVIWHRPVTNCIFVSHFKYTNRVEQFNIQQLIAKGAFGCVLKVSPKNQTVHECFALKSIRKSKVIRNNCIQQIKDEADIQKICGHHQFIVQHIETWQDRRHLYILSEYVANGELFSKICNFTIDLIRLYVAEIALAIDFLHNAGVIYRDAKPENILLTHNYHIKLTDFGLSKWLKIGEKTRTMCGTYQYMAPEILRNNPYGHSVDWWALGVIACEMFIKKGPNTEEFIKAAPSDVDKPAAIQDFLPDEFQTIPNEGRDLILRLLDIDPRIRLHSVMNLQRIALYKNFKIDLKSIQNISPNDIIQKDCISIKTNSEVPSIDFDF